MVPEWADGPRGWGNGLIAQGETTGMSYDAAAASAAAPPRKRRRIFLWFFLAVQLLFALWVGFGIAATSGPATDCRSLSQETCDNAQFLGGGIALLAMFFLWVAVDFILGVSYGIYRLATRR